MLFLMYQVAKKVDCNYLEAHGLMYNDKPSDYSEQLCSPQNYPVSDKEVINMNCKDPSLKNEVNNSSLYNLLPLIFSLRLHFTLIIGHPQYMLPYYFHPRL